MPMERHLGLNVIFMQSKAFEHTYGITEKTRTVPKSKFGVSKIQSTIVAHATRIAVEVSAACAHLYFSIDRCLVSSSSNRFLTSDSITYPEKWYRSKATPSDAGLRFEHCSKIMREKCSV